VLHDWIATVGELHADALRVTNVGADAERSITQVHGVEVITFPELEGVNYQEQIYCPGTKFIDLDKGRLTPSYGGGSHTEGIYEGAVTLSNGDDFESENMESTDGEFGRITIPLEPGKKLVQAEISVGDTEHLDYVSAKTGRPTRLGYAKLRVGIQKRDESEINWFIQDANVPPQGVISGGPRLEENLIDEGDRLVVESRSDTSHVMGWRIAYKEAGEQIQSTAEQN
jgi:hypothetical protein